MRNELSLQRMKALFESQRVLEMERKLFASERQLQASQGENLNLQVLLEELQIKSEAEGKRLHSVKGIEFNLFLRLKAKLLLVRRDLISD